MQVMPRASYQDMPAVCSHIRRRREPKALLRGLSQGREAADVPRLRPLWQTVRAFRPSKDRVLLTRVRVCAPWHTTEEAETDTHSRRNASAANGRLLHPGGQAPKADCLRTVRRRNRPDRGCAQRLSEAAAGAMVVHSLSPCVGQSGAERRHHPSLAFTGQTATRPDGTPFSAHRREAVQAD